MVKIKCIKDVEFAGRTYAKKGEMIEVVDTGMFFMFNGSNDMYFSLSADYACQHFQKSDIEKLIKNK